MGKPDPARLSEIRFKGGLIVVGTILGLQNGLYSVATDLGVVSIDQERVASITAIAAKSAPASATVSAAASP